MFKQIYNRELHHTVYLGRENLVHNFNLNTTILLKANNFACFDSLVLEVSFLSFSMLIALSFYVYNCRKVFSSSMIFFSKRKKKKETAKLKPTECSHTYC